MQLCLYQIRSQRFEDVSVSPYLEGIHRILGITGDKHHTRVRRDVLKRDSKFQAGQTGHLNVAEYDAGEEPLRFDHLESLLSREKGHDLRIRGSLRNDALSFIQQRPFIINGKDEHFMPPYPLAG